MNNQEQLTNICTDIYTITGIKPVIYNAKMQIIYAHPLAMCAFCKELRKDPINESRCLYCDQTGFEACRKSGELYIYQCHMGLTEAVAPIIDRGSVIGYLLFGQLLQNEAKEKIEEQIKKGSFGNKQLLLKHLAAMEPSEEHIIRASARLMAMCTSYLRLQNILKQQQEDLTAALTTYINEHLSEDLSSPALCKQFGISRSTLYVLSKNSLGMGIGSYIRNCRIKKAIKLLQSSSLPVYQIAEEVGIQDANYFSKLIKQQTGKSPKKIQKDLR